MTFRLWLPTAMAIIALGGCSTQPYQEQVNQMSANLTEVKKSFADMSEQERKAFVDSQIGVKVNSGADFVAPEKCDVKAGVPREEIDCVLQTADPASHERSPIIFEPAAPKGLALASAVDRYGAGLKQLADAVDVAALKEAAGDTAAAITNLAGTIKKAGGDSGAVVAVGPVTTVAVGLFSAYLDSARLTELRKAVDSASTHIDSASELLGDQAALLQENIVRSRATKLKTKTLLLKDFRIKHPAERDKISQMANELLSESIALENYARTDPKAPFATMKSAHEELANSLKNPEIDLGTVFAKLKEFGEQIQSLRAVLTAI